ncbi:DUF2637 domain-containing protein [Mycobacterium intracellulare]|uniref:DUF2637 domain-containing protein n=1 Tax=Mycobacterium intracellulare TaxID=1767 RepID=UPI000BAC13EB|nr:DUF2637 domain-containing protein [Mycobacterium intracellulare]ASX03566.1 hypothetical protein CKJ58_26475 [Mycobacterium intracellulare subsp. chimaera]PBA61349.1 hypothetical protein CKJ56_13445 [Mycobacterium intracellulare subsp. chimaera]
MYLNFLRFQDWKDDIGMADSIRVHPWAALLIRIAAVAMAIFVGVCSFILSFTALTDVATRCHVPARQAWLWPCAVDGATLLATLGVVVCMPDPRARRFFWAVLLGGLLVSIVGNDLHAILPPGQELPWALRAVVGAVAPIAVVVSIHGLTILMRVRRIQSEQKAQTPRADAKPGPSAASASQGAPQRPHSSALAAAPATARDRIPSGSSLHYDALTHKVMQLITVKDVDADQVSSALQMSYEMNLPNRDIGRRLDMSHHTVGKIVDASAQVLREEPLAQVS